MKKTILEEERKEVAESTADLYYDLASATESYTEKMETMDVKSDEIKSLIHELIPIASIPEIYFRGVANKLVDLENFGKIDEAFSTSMKVIDRISEILFKEGKELGILDT